jgi:hypothetical protein
MKPRNQDIEEIAPQGSKWKGSNPNDFLPSIGRQLALSHGKRVRISPKM